MGIRQTEWTAAVVCLGGDRTELRPWPAPAPGEGEVVLRLRVSGLCGTDLFKLRTGGAANGSVLGHEIVGEVASVGPGVRSFREGDRVVVPHHVPCGSCDLCLSGSQTMCPVFKENLLAPGGFADAVLVRPRAVAEAARLVPAGVGDEAAVFMEPAACVLRGIDRSGLGGDGLAVVLGAGSMGLLHLLTIRAALPQARTVVIDPDGARRALAARLGADATAPPGGEADAAVRELSAGAGADAVFDTVGGERTLAAGLAAARAGGTVVLFAHAGVGVAAGFDLNAFFKREQRVIATYSGALDEQRRVFDLITSGALDPTPLVTHRMPLDDFSRGVELTEQRAALKVLFTPSRMAVSAR